MSSLRQPNALLRGYLSDAVHTAALDDPEPDELTRSSARKRARVDPGAGSRLATVSLVQSEDGVLRWAYDPPPASSRRRVRRARRAGASVDDGEVIDGFQFLEVPPNQVVRKLADLDLSMTPERGLRRWVGGVPTPLSKAPGGRVLLLVHGTFSRGDMFFQELGATPEGQALLAKIESKYDAIVTFDHPTLAMSPWLNALDLTRAMARCTGPVDVVCHSRGGLTAAWWLLHARPPVEKVVFVGSPLEGTSLASPAKLKQALDLLGNLARAIGAVGNAAATAMPMLAFAGGVMKILGGILSFGAKSPLIDAGVAMIPGLAAQSRVGNNFELERLFSHEWAKSFRLYAIQSNYEPSRPTEPWWKFWQHFRRIPGRVADWGADHIFDGPNDLVVDTASMIRLGHVGIPKSRRLEFDGDAAVHHCAYFRQKQTLDFLTSILKL